MQNSKMNWIQSKLGKYFNETLFRNAFILWFLLFPFDANVLPVSIGFITIYPYLLLTFFLLGYSFLSNPMEQCEKSDKFVIGFFFLWVIYALCFYPFIKGKSFAYYEIRSLLLMSVTVWLLFRIKYLFGKKYFFEILYQLSLLLFITLTAFAFFEFFTGIHFSGKHTEKLWDLPAEMFTYAPVFLYDNPNNFLSYFFGLAIIIILSDFQLNYKPFKILLIILTLFFFSVVSDSKFGKIAVFLLFLSFIINNIMHINATTFKKYFWWFAVVFISLLFCFTSKSLYFGPMWGNEEHYYVKSINPVKIENNQVVFYSSDTLVKHFGEKNIARSLFDYQMQNTMYSNEIRVNLLKNGFYLFKKSMLFGIGPGQYCWYHEHKLVPYPTITVTSPHDGLMEILSQYGLPIFIPYIFIFIFYWFKTYRNRKSNWNYFIIITICYLLFIIISDMPSAFLNLNIGWILIPVLLISSYQLQKENNV